MKILEDAIEFLMTGIENDALDQLNTVITHNTCTVELPYSGHL